jgi:hypothetical protein
MAGRSLQILGMTSMYDFDKLTTYHFLSLVLQLSLRVYEVE